MTNATRRAAVFRLVFYLGATLFILAVWQYQKHMTGNWIEPLTPTLSCEQGRELDALLEMNRLITTLGTGLLAAIGFLLVNVRQPKRGSQALWAACCSAICVGFSLFFGYVVYLGIISMLQNQYFDLDVGPILWARQAHFYSFLLGAVLFGDFAFHNLHVEDGYERKHGTSEH
jgi:hypothetical protein